MAGNRPLEQLGKHASVQGGFAFKSSDFTDSGVPVLKIKNVRLRDVDLSEVEFVETDVAKSASRYFCKYGDLLISMTGSGPQAPSSVVGRVARFTGPSDTYLFNQRVGRIVINDPSQLDARFLFFVLTQREYQSRLVSVATGSANQANISGGQIESVEIPVPPPKEQRAIAHVLGTLDDKIELNRRMNETLEAMARALFKSWFVDFDPVRAKAAGGDPCLPKHIADLFPDRFEDSELGEIPIGWQVKTVGDFAEVVGGGTPSTKEPTYWYGGMHCWATPKDLSALAVPVLLHTDRCITDSGLAQISSGLLPVGTVLLSSRAPIGYLAVAEVPVAINQGFIAMKPKEDSSNLFLLFWASFAHDDILSRANGSTFLEISKANFRPIQVVAPAAQVMEAFDWQIRPLHKRIVENERASRTLAVLRDTLLPKLISGKLRIKEGKCIAEMAT